MSRLHDSARFFQGRQPSTAHVNRPDLPRLEVWMQWRDFRSLDTSRDRGVTSRAGPSRRARADGPAHGQGDAASNRVGARLQIQATPVFRAASNSTARTRPRGGRPRPASTTPSPPPWPAHPYVLLRSIRKPFQPLSRLPQEGRASSPSTWPCRV